MTREEAVKAIKSHYYFANLVPAGKEALDMAIKVLAQEPCEDCVSRAELKKWLDMNFSFGGASRKFELFDRLDKELPPVTPQPKTDAIDKSNFSQEQYKADLQSAYDCGRWQKQKTGHWFYDKSIENWRCSECNETPKTMGYCGSANFMAKHFKFCNHCGARMVEPQESDG